VTADPTPLVVTLLALVLGVAAIAATARDVLVATVVFGAYSLGLAILWVVFRAPDVGLTEAAVGAGVTTSLFLAAIAKTAPPAGESAFSLRYDPRALLVGGAVVGALGLSLPALPAVGDPSAPVFADDAAAAFYLGDTARFGIDNVVTAILVVYRGFDTFGEIAVVFAAGVAVLVVLGNEREAS
jgi:multicomponent Na+:H+ antiporter subunit B